VALTEFGLIKRYFSNLVNQQQAVALGVGDDCALLRISPDCVLATSVDTLGCDVHFPAQAEAADIAHRALAVNLSDLAAMGAKPLAFTLALTLPEVDESWLASFAAGLAESAAHYGVALIGGDTTRGPLSITVTVYGELEEHLALCRHGAKAGDAVYVSGSLGDSARALEQILAGRPNDDYFHNRFFKPEVDFALAQALCGKASAAIDVSDGLLADLGHIAAASDVGIVLNAEAIPLSNELLRCGERDALLRDYALAGGEDFRLAFCMPEHQEEALKRAGHCFTRIGLVEAGAGLQLLNSDGNAVNIEEKGFQHF
jgi:thiamine-monophosphate kinase